jgi:hypothetical protein
VVARRLATFFILGWCRSHAAGSGLLRLSAGSEEAGWAFLLAPAELSPASSGSAGSGVAELRFGDTGRSTIGGSLSSGSGGGGYVEGYTPEGGSRSCVTIIIVGPIS